MGIFSDIWKGVKNVFKGIMKVFEPILKPLGKLLNSKLGKALMIGLSIFTLGSAMVAGYGAFTAAQAAGQGFISSFVEGGKVFLQTMVGKGGEKAAEGAGQTATAAADQAAMASQTGSMNPALLPEAQGAIDSAAALAEGSAGSGAFGPAQALDQPMRAVTSGAEGASGAGAMLPPDAGGLSQSAGEVARTGVPAVTGTPGTEAVGGAIESTAGKGWLEKAKDMGKSFAEYSTSEGGGQVVGSLIQAGGQYLTEKDRQEFEDRVRRDWMKGAGSSGVRDVRAASGRVAGMRAPSAQDIARAGRATAREGGQRPYFERAYGAGAGG